MEKIKLFECYAGYGGTSFGLKKANIPFECVGMSEINKKQIELYNLNHHNIKNYGDITKINVKELPDFDLITGGFPCQDVSIAGLRDLQKGRTKTVFKMLEIIKIKKPKYCLLENVEGILSMLEGELLREIVRLLKSYGYAVSYQLLKSKDYGTPQNRPRVWIACELDKSHFGFNPFPYKEQLELFVNDLLELKIEDKYFPSNKMIKFWESRIGEWSNIIKEISPTLTVSKATLDNNWVKDLKTNKLRYLTPRECFRLQGFFNDEIKFGDIKDTNLYKSAGNGWDINLVSKIFSKWFK